MGVNQRPTPDSLFLKTLPMNHDLEDLLAIKIFDPRSKEMKQRYPVPADQAEAILKLLASPRGKMEKVVAYLYQRTAVDDPGICLLGHCLQTIGMLRREMSSARAGQKSKPFQGLIQTIAQARKNQERLAKTIKTLHNQLQECGMDLPVNLYLDWVPGQMKLNVFNALEFRRRRNSDGGFSVNRVSMIRMSGPDEYTIGKLLAQVAQHASERVNQIKEDGCLLTGLNRKNALRIFAIRRLHEFWCHEMQLPRSDESTAEIGTFILEQSGLDADQSALNDADVQSALRGWVPAK